jgi:ABC-type Zn uptake system ZnuABC Zn-binding protein ZnuA
MNTAPPSRHASIRGRLLFVLGLVAVLLWSGCRRRQAAAPEPIRVLGTYYALADLAKQVGGDRVVVDWVLEDGQDTHVELNDDLRKRLLAADLIVAGGNCDAWAIGGFEDPNREQRIVRIDMLPNAPSQTIAGYPWLDPDMAKELCRDLATRLSVKVPLYAGMFHDNADSYCKKIDDAVQRHSAALWRLPRPRVLAMSDESAPLTRHFGIDLTPVFDEAPRVIGPQELRAISMAARPRDAAETGSDSAGNPVDTSEQPDSHDASHGADLPLDAFHQMYVQAANGGAPTLAPPRPAACALLVDVCVPQEVLHQLSDQVNLPVLQVDAIGSSAAATGGKQSYLDLLNYDMDQLARVIAPQGAQILPTIIAPVKNSQPAGPTFKQLGGQ